MKRVCGHVFNMNGNISTFVVQLMLWTYLHELLFAKWMQPTWKTHTAVVTTMLIRDSLNRLSTGTKFKRLQPSKTQQQEGGLVYLFQEHPTLCNMPTVQTITVGLDLKLFSDFHKMPFLLHFWIAPELKRPASLATAVIQYSPHCHLQFCHVVIINTAYVFFPPQCVYTAHLFSFVQVTKWCCTHSQVQH